MKRLQIIDWHTATSRLTRLRRMHSRPSAAFTLIEVLVVITIIGVLIGLSAAAYRSARVAGRDAKRKADLADIRSALEIYRTDCGSYPSSLTFEGALLGFAAACSGNTYMSKVPQDPIRSTQSYYYLQTGGNSYQLCAHLEQTPASSDGCTGSCGGQVCNYKVTNP